MMEVALLLLNRMFGHRRRDLRKETLTTYTTTVPEMKAWKERTFQGMTERAAVKPITAGRQITVTAPLPKSDIVTGAGLPKRRGIGGGPPVTTTRTTVTYEPVKPKFVLK